MGTGWKAVVLGSAVLTFAALGQTPQGAKRAEATATAKQDKATAYYHYALGHLYAELAATYNNRGDYFNRAIENYRLAIKADPSASFLAEELSDLYIQSGRLREAVSDAEGILAQNPNDLNARRILARIYARLINDQQNKIDETYLKKAIEQYQRITEREPKDNDSWLMLGRLQKIAQNSVEAEKAFKSALANDPDSEDALTGLAMVYADLGDAKNAAEMLRKVSEKSPSGRSLAALASAYEQMREYGLAAEALRKAIELSPAAAGELKRSLARDLMLADQLDESLKVYQEIAREEPRDAEAQLRLSQIYRQKRDFANARAASNKARELEPNSLEIRFNEVNLLEAEGKPREAIDLMKEIVASTAKKTYSAAERGNRVVLLERLGAMYRANDQVAPAVETFRQMGEVDADMGGRSAVQIVETYRMAKDLAKAEAEARNAIAKFPNDRMVRTAYASLLADSGKNEAAISEMKKLLSEHPDREMWMSLAQVYDKTKQYPEMANALAEADKLSQNKDEKQAVQFMRGAMFEKQKKFEQAEAEFRQIIEADPDNAGALNYLGYMMADRGVRLQEALQLITRALEIDPGNGAYLDSLGWVYYRLGRYEEAEEQLRLALEKVPRDATVHDHLGDAYYKQGKLKDAISQWEVALNEWRASAPAEQDTTEIAKIQQKLEGAKVQLAKQNSAHTAKP